MICELNVNQPVKSADNDRGSAPEIFINHVVVYTIAILGVTALRGRERKLHSDSWEPSTMNLPFLAILQEPS